MQARVEETLFRFGLRVGLALLGLSFAGTCFAQNMQVLGGSSIAKECFQASAAAVLTGTASGRDLEFCDKALHYGGLGKKDRIATYVNRGVLNVALQNYQDAVKDYNYAIKLNPAVPEAYLNRGNLWLIANQHDEAIVDYDKAMELGVHKYHVALMNKGMAYESKGDYLKARELYLSALEKRQDWPTAKTRLERIEKRIAKAKKG
jgi:tetratricopeptide (TPR) repeat protein